VLGDVGSHRLLTHDQLRRLHFTEGSELGATRRAQRVLRRLVDDGYLQRLPRRVGGVRSGSAGFVYSLGYRGQRVIEPGRRARTPEPPGERFVGHTLSVSELYVQLTELARNGGIEQLRVEPEPVCWRWFAGLGGQLETLRPDLGLRLVQAELELSWFVEVDRSTETLRTVRTKCEHYLAYWQSGREQATRGVFPRVLWSVPEETRRSAVAAVIGGLPEPGPQLFSVATASRSVAVLAAGQSRKGGKQ
jgi:hypothetical protein